MLLHMLIPIEAAAVFSVIARSAIAHSEVLATPDRSDYATSAAISCLDRLEGAAVKMHLTDPAWGWNRIANYAAWQMKRTLNARRRR